MLTPYLGQLKASYKYDISMILLWYTHQKDGKENTKMWRYYGWMFQNSTLYVWLFSFFCDENVYFIVVKNW